jgi:phosphoglycerate dehydrogenase-like enzyme
VLLGLPGGCSPWTRSRRCAAHSRVDVACAESAERFAELLPGADAAIVWYSFAPLLAPALQPGGRLRWVQSVSVGVDALLTPELVAAEYVLVTASKWPMGPALAEHALLLLLALARDLPATCVTKPHGAGRRRKAFGRWWTYPARRCSSWASGRPVGILRVSPKSA